MMLNIFSVVYWPFVYLWKDIFSYTLPFLSSVVYLSVELKSSLYTLDTVQFSSVQSLSGVQLFATP